MEDVEDFDPLDIIYANSGLKRPEKSIVETVPVPEYRRKNAEAKSIYEDRISNGTMTDDEDDDEYAPLTSRQIAIQTEKDIREAMQAYCCIPDESEHSEIVVLSSDSDVCVVEDNEDKESDVVVIDDEKEKEEEESKPTEIQNEKPLPLYDLIKNAKRPKRKTSPFV